MTRSLRAPLIYSLIGFALFALGSCTEANLRKLSRQAVYERNQVVGRICAPPHTTLDVPYRILFVIDTSLSNEWNDPDKRRQKAVREAINTHITKENVSFGVITFSDVPRVQTLSFTRDTVVLDGATKHVGVAQGGTNFSDTLWVAKSFIMEDLSSMTPNQALRTHYIVFWLSDGFPTIGTTEPASILPMAKTWSELLSKRVAKFELHTAFLGAKKAASKAEEDEAKRASELLEGMAGSGGGVFTDIPSGQAFSFDIDPAPIQALFELRGIVASNYHVRFEQGAPVADSDADGISDQRELELGLEPNNADTDGDGYRDGIELLVNGNDPLVYDPGCNDSERDQDQDGLSDCEEQLLGTSPTRADSDADQLPDVLEVLAGGAPLDGDNAADRDHDGISDSNEVWYHLDPKNPTKGSHRDNWAYRYEIKELPQHLNPTADRCYRLSINNVVMVPTERVFGQPKAQT
jgi:uncharacterized protein YegL